MPQKEIVTVCKNNLIDSKNIDFLHTETIPVSFPLGEQEKRVRSGS